MKIENKFPTKDISDEDIKTKFPLVAKKNASHKSKFTISNVEFGGDLIPVFAGPNMVESEKLILDCAKNVKNYIPFNCFVVPKRSILIMIFRMMILIHYNFLFIKYTANIARILPIAIVIVNSSFKNSIANNMAVTGTVKINELAF